MLLFRDPGDNGKLHNFLIKELTRKTAVTYNHYNQV